MADGPESPPVIDLGEREGKVVSIITDPSMVLESFRRGWVGSLEEAQRQYDIAKRDTEEYCNTKITDEERAIARQNLAKLAMMLFAQHTRAVAEAHKQTKEDGGDTHNHLHLHGSDVRAMSSDERRAYIADLRRRIEAARS